MIVKTLAEKFNIDYKGIQKNETGKPFLVDSDANIAISHSFPIAAAMIHLEKPCGIDMERPREKHRLVQHKFLHEAELSYQNDLKNLCTIWCAKEVIYKIFGRKFLSLKDEIKTSFVSENIIVGDILKKGHETTHSIHYEWVKDYVLAYGT